MRITIVTFYHFSPIADVATVRERLHRMALQQHLKGTLLLAEEGMNATLAGVGDAVTVFMEKLAAVMGVMPRCHYSSAEQYPFAKLKVKIKPEIVALKTSLTAQPGRHAQGVAWEMLLDDPDTVVIDTRNDYEYQAGTFKNALNPGIRSFRQLPAWFDANLDPARHKRIAMFCTGGVRCEKASAYLHDKGFADVVQLEGGILAYLRDAGDKAAYWQGACVVFDDREAVDSNLQPVTNK